MNVPSEIQRAYAMRLRHRTTERNERLIAEYEAKGVKR